MKAPPVKILFSRGQVKNPIPPFLLVLSAQRLASTVTPSAGPRQVTMNGTEYMMHFAFPNFYFHAATAYDILRSKGVPLGKRDFMGRLNLKKA